MIPSVPLHASFFSCLRRTVHAVLWSAGLTAPLWSAAPAATPVVFRHEGFAQLSRGELGNAGQNLFVSKRGELKLINWLDLDRDGYPELLINNDHSAYENPDSLIYYQHPVDGFRSLLPTVSDEPGMFERIVSLRKAQGRVDFLPSMGAGRSLIVDLNGDGRPEIIFANFFHGSTLDHYPVYVYWGDEQGYSVTRRSDFASETAMGIAVGDLDGNGRPDLVVANVGTEDDVVAASAGPVARAAQPVVSGATAQSQIYWQKDDGFWPGRTTNLPTRYAVDVKIADLDGDGCKDLIFLQAGDWPSVRVFFGGADGYSAERVREFSVTGRGLLHAMAGEVAVADLDGDGKLDLAVAAGGANLEIFLNRGANFESWSKVLLPANKPLSVAATDLNGDGRADLAVSGYTGGHKEYRTDAYVYWNAPDGFSASRRTTLPVLGASNVRAGDINGDGFVDLAFANTQADDNSYDVPSYIYWGAKDGFAPAHREELTGFQAVGLAIGDLNRDRVPDLFIANRSSGRSHSGGPIDSFIFWGNAQRGYNGANLTKVPLSTGFSSSSGDIFDEGRAAVAYTEDDGVAVARFNPDRSLAQVLRWKLKVARRGFSTTLVDLNHDGRLDLIVGLLDGEGQSLAILRGGENGFAEPQYFKPGLSILATEVADIDGDGRLDMVLGGRGGWLYCPITADGSPDFTKAQRIVLPFQIQRLTVADLNNDGLPEVVVTHYRDMKARTNNIESAIYWNRRGKFSYADRTPLPTMGGHWVSVADTRGRGTLDVVYSNYHSETSRIGDLFVYSPNEKGEYGLATRWTLPALSSGANAIADFDGDGFTDIAVINHTGPSSLTGLQPKSGEHGIGSYLYWGSAKGFDPERRTTVPSYGPHRSTNADFGDILRRRPFETYASQPVEASLEAGDYDLVVSGVFRGRTGCGVSVQLDKASTWTDLKVVSTTESEIRCRLPVASRAARLRYRLELRTGGAGTGPTVTAIELRRSEPAR